MNASLIKEQAIPFERIDTGVRLAYRIAVNGRDIDFVGSLARVQRKCILPDDPSALNPTISRPVTDQRIAASSVNEMRALQENQSNLHHDYPTPATR